MTTIAMLGSGIMASALTVPLADNGHDIRLVGTHLDREIIRVWLSWSDHAACGMTPLR